jgi:type I restriction enzyme R subunit
VAGLPSQLVDDDQEAKQFDLLMLRLELALLRVESSFSRMLEQVRGIAGLLEEKSAIPMVQQQMPLILEIQTDDYWQDVTVPLLESARKRLRSLVKLIEKAKRRPVYSDFEDLMGAEAPIELPGFGSADYERFRTKTRQFLREHENDVPIRKLRWNEPLTPGDLTELETLLIKAGTGTKENIERAKSENNGLGLFVRSLVGLDRQAAKKALDQFLNGRALSAVQIDFINVVIDYLTLRGWG